MIAYVMVIYISGASAAGLTTISYYNNIENCQKAGEVLLKTIKEKYTLPNVNFYCVPVDTIK